MRIVAARGYAACGGMKLTGGVSHPRVLAGWTPAPKSRAELGRKNYRESNDPKPKVRALRHDGCS
jgi:hypothetical protein